MLRGLILLDWFGTIGDMFSVWEQAGFFSYLLPFLLIFALVFGISMGILSLGVFYLFAKLSIFSTSRKIDVNLPIISNFMAVLANSGMPPERILRSLGVVGDEFGVGEEIRRAVGDVELMGKDLKGALRNAAVRSSSRKFSQELLQLNSLKTMI